MSQPESRGVSPFWALLLLPLALGVGVLVGRVPPPKAKEAPLAANAPPVVVAPSSRPASGAESHGGSASEFQSSLSPVDTDPPASETPREREKPKEEPAVLSQWTSLEDAMAESKRNGKPVMIDFNADWCGPCQRMRQQVFEDYSHGHAVQMAVIPVSIVDRRREEGRNPPEIDNLQQRFGVDAFPTLVVFSPATAQMVKTQGFGDADATTAWITEAAKSVR